jgi:hypothetical protein
MTIDVSPKNRVLILALIAATAAAGCARESTPSEMDLVVPVFSNGGGHSAFGTHMTGAEETPPRPSAGQGQLILTPREDGTSLRYKLMVANIENVTQAHIHFAVPGVAGPVIAWLYPAAPPATLIPGPFNGVLAEGVITDANVVGPLAGQGVAALVAAIEAGTAYANVHTTQFPPGEIRGQVR